MWSVLKYKYSYCSSSLIWYWVIGCNMVTWPIPLVKPSLKSTLAPTFRYSGCLMNLKSTTAFSPVLSSSCVNQTTQMQDSEAEEQSQRSNCSKCGTDRVIHSFHRGRLPHVAYVHGHLETLVKGLWMKEQHDLGLKPPADGGVHLWAHHHHPLQETNRPYNWHGGQPPVLVQILGDFKQSPPCAAVTGQSCPGQVSQPDRPWAPDTLSDFFGCSRWTACGTVQSLWVQLQEGLPHDKYHYTFGGNDGQSSTETKVNNIF